MSYLFRAICLLILFTLPAAAQGWAARVEAARSAEARGDIESAFTIYSELARQGTPYAMNALGRLYGDYRKDDEKALLWCTVAGGFGHAVDFACIQQSERRLSRPQIERVRLLAKQCSASKFQACDTLDARWNAQVRSNEAIKCFVNDPTGTDLNYRTAPGGKVIGQIANFGGVTIMDSGKDARGKEWVYVKGHENDTPLGWVIRSYLKCGG